MSSAPEFFFEDFPVGQVLDYGSYHVTAEEIVSFAREFDPQPFHVDEKAAKASMLGDAPCGQRSFIPNSRSSCLHGVLDLGRWFPKHRGSPKPTAGCPSVGRLA